MIQNSRNGGPNHSGSVSNNATGSSIGQPTIGSNITFTMVNGHGGGGGEVGGGHDGCGGGGLSSRLAMNGSHHSNEAEDEDDDDEWYPPSPPVYDVADKVKKK